MWCAWFWFGAGWGIAQARHCRRARQSVPPRQARHADLSVRTGICHSSSVGFNPQQLVAHRGTPTLIPFFTAGATSLGAALQRLLFQGCIRAPVCRRACSSSRRRRRSSSSSTRGAGSIRTGRGIERCGAAGAARLVGPPAACGGGAGGGGRHGSTYAAVAAGPAAAGGGGSEFVSKRMCTASCKRQLTNASLCRTGM